MAGVALGWAAWETAVLVTGFGLAACYDWKAREVSDRLWQVLATIGVFTGIVVLASDGALAVTSWIVVSLLALQHLFPWDIQLERCDERLPTVLETIGFLAVTGVLVWIGLRYGLGPSGLPIPVIAAFASILLGRGLFEARLLYGGADAKALITAGVVLPLESSVWVALPSSATAILAIYPFSLTLLMNAAIVAIAVPLYLAVRNVRDREFTFPRGFTGLTIPVSELPDRFVWLKDPTFRSQDEAETSEEDRAQRVRQKTDLESRGVLRVWVTPQIPFLVLMFAGAILGVVFGNLVFDLLAYL